MPPVSAYKPSFLLLLFIYVIFLPAPFPLPFLGQCCFHWLISGHSEDIFSFSGWCKCSHVLSFGGFWHWIYSGQCTCNIFLKAGVDTGKSLLSCACVTCQRSTEEHREDVATPDCYTSMSLTCFSRQVWLGTAARVLHEPQEWWHWEKHTQWTGQIQPRDQHEDVTPKALGSRRERARVHGEMVAELWTEAQPTGHVPLIASAWFQT